METPDRETFREEDDFISNDILFFFENFPKRTTFWQARKEFPSIYSIRFTKTQCIVQTNARLSLGELTLTTR